MTIALLNARLVCPSNAAGDDPITGGVLIEGHCIAAVGTFAVPEGAEVIDCRGKILAPALLFFAPRRTVIRK